MHLVVLRSIAVVAALSALGEEVSDTMVVLPKPEKRVVVNPGKGWVLYGGPFGANRDLLPLSSLGYRRFEWADLEPQEGQFDWSPIEKAAAAWDKEGKQFAFGVMCLSSHTGKKDGYVTPKWVFDAGAAHRVVKLEELKHRMAGTPGTKVVPDFNDPVFLQKLAAFLSAMGTRFDGDPRIAFIDVRSYGNWGEGHMYPFGGETISAEEFRYHVQLHIDAFRKTRLCLSCENRNSPHVSVYDWAVREKGFAARRDGICGNSDGSETLRAFGIAPAVFELFGPYDFLKEQGWWAGHDNKERKNYGFRLADCVETGKASYCDLSRGGASGKALLAAEPELVERLANRMGYHFVLTKAVLPREFVRDAAGTGTFFWRNDGVAPIYVPCEVAVGLLDAAGQVADRCWMEACTPSRWMPGETVEECAAIRFSRAASGEYRLAVGLFRDRNEEKPYIELGIEGERVHGWHILDHVRVR